MIILEKNKCYTLTEEEIEFAKQVAAQRSAGSRAAGIVDARQSEVDSSLDIDIKGAMGEIAFAGLLKKVGIYSEADYQAAREQIQDPTIRTAASGQDIGDVVIRDKNVDVKTTHYQNGHLVVSAWKSKATQIHAYALMIGDYTQSPIYRFAGVCSPDYAHQQGCWVKQQNLRAIKFN